MSYDFGRIGRIPFDPRMVREISSNPRMAEEQVSAPIVERWGGFSGYKKLSTLPYEERMVYASVLEGATSKGEMEVMTGLSSKEVNRGLQGLDFRGLINAGIYP